MKLKKKRIALLFLLLAVSAVLPAQTNPSASDKPERPQWLRDLHRWEIITFGSIPFAMFFTTFVVDMFRWSDNDWDNKYAPWPFKSTGAVAMTSSEMEKTVTIAAGVAVTIGLADHIIVRIKRQRAQRRAEALPVGTVVITRSPWGDDPEPADDIIAIDDETEPLAPEQNLPATP